MNENTYVTIGQAATMLGVSRKVIYRLIRQGKLSTDRKPILEGGPHLIPRAQVQEIADRDAKPQP